MFVNPEDLNVNFFLPIFYLCLLENEADEETGSYSYSLKQSTEENFSHASHKSIKQRKRRKRRKRLWFLSFRLWT